MACANKPTVSQLPVVELSFAEARARICHSLDCSDGDICLPTEQKSPGRSSISKGAMRPELSCPLGHWGAIVSSKCPTCPRSSSGGQQCVYCTNKARIGQKTPATKQPDGVKSRCVRCTRLAVLSDKNLCVFCVNKETLKQTNKAALRRPTSPFSARGVPAWVSLAQYTRDIHHLASMVPADVKTIVGVARSGITPAAIIASLLHLPLLSIRQTKNDIVEVGNGWRLGGNQHIVRGGNALVVDDTVMTGNSLRAIESLVAKHFPGSQTCAVYVNPLAHRKPDFWSRDLGWPHLLEWNIFNSVLSPNIAVDFDGILCHDCPPGSDDDGPRYLDFIRNARPKYIARKVPIPMIVTARIEKYREETLAWLRRHGMHTYNLVMHPAATLTERRRDDIAAFKASHYLDWAKRHRPRPAPIIFIESEDWQARRIAEISKLMTICPDSGGVYQR